MKISKDNNNYPGKLLADMLEGEFAHAGLEQAVKNLPFKFLGIKPQGIPYSIWQLTEHIRISQWDIVEFSLNEAHESPSWPDDYWPKEDAPKTKENWTECLKKIRGDRKRFIKELIKSGKDVYQPFKYGNGQNLFREAVLLIDHTSYHTGQIILIRKILGIW